MTRYSWEFIVGLFFYAHVIGLFYGYFTHNIGIMVMVGLPMFFYAFLVEGEKS